MIERECLCEMQSEMFKEKRERQLGHFNRQTAGKLMNREVAYMCLIHLNHLRISVTMLNSSKNYPRVQNCELAEEMIRR